MSHSSQHTDLRQSAWVLYRGQFRAEALLAGRDERFIERALAYARRLSDRGLPIIFDNWHLSALVGVDWQYLLRCTNQATRFYRSFEIAKRSGKLRTISAPLPTLKYVQQWILTEILARVTPSRYAHAYRQGASIKNNARLHLKQSVLVLLDVKDFFPAISGPSVYRVFRDLGYTRSVSATLAGLTTLDGGLPQGAPTSPSLSNLVCRQIDARIGGYCMRRNWRFTRYADDLAFSGNLNVPKLIRFVERVLADYGLKLNAEKSRALRRHQCQVVTGIVVNEFPRIKRSLRRKLRQAAYYIDRHGLADHMSRLKIEQANYRAFLLGKAYHARFVHSADRDASALIAALSR